MRRTSARRAAVRTGLAAIGVGVLVAGAVPGATADRPDHAGKPAHAGTAADAGKGCTNANNNTYQKLLECVSAEGVLEHLEAFQAIADQNGDTRASGTPGYDASIEYVVQRLEAAGWEVSLDPFEFLGPDVELEIIGGESLETSPMAGSVLGDVTGSIVAVDLSIANPAASTSGCEAADFAGLDFSGPDDIALIQRGACAFAVKAQNAEAAGAEAVIIFNTGTEGNTGLINGTIAGSGVEIPVVEATFDAGVLLAQTTSEVRVTVEPTTTYNVIAEKEGRNDDNVVMAGAHLDSVLEGPGINDNASGSGALLEIAETISKLKPENTIRLAWWGAEENGLVGSTAYVEELSQAELDRIALYLNFDMVASPNYVPFVYDADESSFEAPVPVPEGSIAIEDVFESFYTWQGLPYEDTAFSGRSDYQAFINNGIPSSGLFTGAEGVKTDEQAEIWGGTAGDWYDPCYHQACDDINNISMEALDVNVDAIAFALLTFAYSTESVNGLDGRDVPGTSFEIPAPAGPAGTVGSNAGGGLDHDHHVEG